MQFPFSLWDTSLWLAITAAILLVTSELIRPYYGRINIIIEKRRLRQAALIVSYYFTIYTAIVFLFTIVEYLRAQ